jgi:hypothetical protein
MLCFLTFQASAQDMSRELGLRFSGVQDIDFMYKKSEDGMKYKRYRVAASNVRLLISEGTDFGFEINLAAGVEKRQNIADKLKFIHGWEPGFNFSLVNSDGSTGGDIGVFLGYVLGFQYDFSDKFYVSLETIPTLSVSTFYEDEIFADVIDVNAGFNSNAVAVTLAYKFSSPKRK